MATSTKLYNVPRRTWIEFEGDDIFFDHIDGAYSLCYFEGDMCHLAAWTEVTISENQDRTV